MQYQAALNYLLGQLPMFQRVGAAAYRADLTNITALCNYLGNPQNDLKCIHIAGTNGKGSVTHIIASVLQSAGYKVGVFVSPHYKDYRERIKINGKLISKNFVTKFVEQHELNFKKINASFFEITTAMAFDYFKHKKVDYAIIETGMGGRLDSTNIITPILSVITNISFDHQQFLGDTLDKIAKEKAGIIKPGVPVIIGKTQVGTRNVFVDYAKKQNAPIVFADLVYDINYQQKTPFSTLLVNKNESLPLTYYTDLSGGYQAQNFTTCFSVFDQLNKLGVKVSDKAVYKGLLSVKKQTSFFGRWMILQDHPTIILDSAHNEDGIRNLKEQLSSMRYKNLHIVFGTVQDKDIAPVLSLLPATAKYYFCRANIPRALDAKVLKEKADLYGLKGNYFDSVSEAFFAAKKIAKKNDLLLVTGSVFVVAELL